MAIQPVQCIPSLPPLLQAVRLLPYLPSPGPLPLLAPAPAPPLVLPKAPALVPEVAEPIPVLDVDPWVEAAKTFQMNTDFDWSHAAGSCHLDLRALQAVMKEESANKRTIQALGDKLMLHRLLKNLGIPQMPALLTVEGPVERRQIEHFVRKHLTGPGSPDVIVKPTHMSNASGVIVLSQPKPEEVESAIDYIQAHITQYMNQQAGVHESVALQSLKPSFIGQPKYQSVVGFKTPLELRVVVLWGKARLGVWWWGRGAAPGEFPQRNAWFVRRPAYEGELSDEDTWEVVHEHRGENLGFEKALELFDRYIHSAAVMAETIAVAVGAPFLRTDFFVGSPEWGLRLNEVAYGCGMEYRNRLEDEGCERIIDDGPAIAQILQEGMAECKRRLPPQHFLSRLGARGESYAEMLVAPVSPARRRRRSLRVAGEEDPPSPDDCAVPEDLCHTLPRPAGNARHEPQCRARSADARTAAAARPGAGRSSPAAAMAAAAAAAAPWPPAPEMRSFSLDSAPLSGMLAAAGLQAPARLGPFQFLAI